MTERLTASNLWRSEICPASAVLPEGPKRKYADAEAGKAEHAIAEHAPPAGAEAEVAFALNVLSGEARRLDVKNREYGELAEGEIAGTADRVFVRPDHVLIQDLKTGVGYLQAEPQVNPQLIHHALSAVTVYGKRMALVQLLYTKTGLVKDGVFDAFDFPEMLARLRSIWEMVKAARTSPPEELIQYVVPDTQVQCWRCPCKARCPIYAKQRRSA